MQLVLTSAFVCIDRQVRVSACGQLRVKVEFTSVVFQLHVLGEILNSYINAFIDIHNFS